MNSISTSFKNIKLNKLLKNNKIKIYHFALKCVEILMLIHNVCEIMLLEEL